MSLFRTIVLFCVFMSFSVLTQAQWRTSDYLVIIDNLSLRDLRGAINFVVEHGMNPKAYWTDSMEAAYQRGGDFNPRLKIQANESYLRLLQDISAGVVDPASLGTDVRMRRKMFVTPAQLRTQLIIANYSARALMESFAPKSAPYFALKQSLRRIVDFCVQGQWSPLPPLKKPLKLGDKDNVLFEIKMRLRQLGYITTRDEIFDLPTLNAVNDVQWTLRFKPDGVLSPNGKTWRYLNVPCEERARTLRLDMEKLRWFPQNWDDRYIFVNLAMSYFNLIDKAKGSLYSMSFRAINGRPERKSPTMSDKIVYTVVNPFWVVPPTIFREDKIEEIRNLPFWEVAAYFERHHYEVWNRSFTQKIDPTTIDWWRLDPRADAEFYIRQKPNYMNALGVVKFMLTNSYAIYLHDTNQRELFVEPQRQLSSGCIRVERPLDLAEYLLEGTPWTRAALEQVMAKPGEVLEKDIKIPVKQPIPIYMAFLTSQLSSDGILRFPEDSYEQNSRLLLRGAW